MQNVKFSQHSLYIGRRCRWSNLFRCLLVGVLTVPASVSPQLRSFIGIRMEIAEAAFRSPSHASRTVFLGALAPLSCGYRWLKL